MIHLSIIGTGNVAFHLAKAFSKVQEVNLQFVAGRSVEKLKEFKTFSATTTALSETLHSDVILLAVSDAAITTVSAELLKTKALIAHTSGSTAITVLENHKRYGVFYPLQTFSKSKELNYNDIPFCIEVKNEGDFPVLNALVEALHSKAYPINSSERAALHLAAVFGNNFGNHLLTETKVLCEDHNVSFQLLKPLLQETLDKAFEVGPENAQTGPARRGDLQTLDKQLASLNKPEQKELYNSLTKAIQNYYER